MILLDILKTVVSRVYLNIFRKDIKKSQLTLSVALAEIFVPTTKTKSNWKRWLGAGFTEINPIKAGFIIGMDFLLFFPRLVINLAKLFTEVLPGFLVELFSYWGNECSKRKPKSFKKNKLLFVGYLLAMGITKLFELLFSLIYLVGCCITSPVSTQIRAKFFFKDNYNGFMFGHFVVPTISATCYFFMFCLLANLVPGLGFLLPILSTITLAFFLAAWVFIGFVLSYFNRSQNTDKLIDIPVPFNSESLLNDVRYADEENLVEYLEDVSQPPKYPNCFSDILFRPNKSEQQSLIEEIKKEITSAETGVIEIENI